MECFNCKTTYNESDRIPRLLVHCGHSICEKCAASLHKDGFIICPECQMYNYTLNVANLPKNLALLHIKTGPAPAVTQVQPQQTPPKPASPVATMSRTSTNSTVSQSINGRIESTSPILNENRAVESQSVMKCPTHRKNVEAFCQNDRMLLCITCILEDGHKAHELNSIGNAAEKERDLMEKVNDLSKIIEGKLHTQQMQIETAYTSLRDDADASRNEITTFFNEIRRVLSERESILRAKVDEQAAREEAIIHAHEEKVLGHLNVINDFGSAYSKMLAQNDYDLLADSTSRLDLITRATVAIDNLQYTSPFTEMPKEAELQYIVKNIAPALKNSNSGAPASTSKPGAGNNAVGQASVKSIVNAAPARAAPTNAQNSKHAKQGGAPANQGGNTSGAGSVGTSKTMVVKKVDLVKTASSVSDQGKAHHKEDTMGNDEDRPGSPGKGSSTTTSAVAKHSANFYEIRAMYKEQQQLEKRGIDHPDASGPGLVEASKKHLNGISGPGIGMSKADAKREVQAQATKATTVVASMTTSVSRSGVAVAGGPGASYQGGKRDLVLDSAPPPMMEMSAIHPNEVTNTTDFFDRDGKTDTHTLIYDIAGGKCNTNEGYDLGASHKMIDLSTLLQGQLNNSYIYVIGGFAENAATIVERADLQKGIWEEVSAAMKSNRAKFGALTLPNGNVLILGGKQDGHRIATCEELDLNGDCTWRLSEITLPTPRSGFGVVIVNNEIIICGGNDGKNVLKNVDAYSLKTKTWRALPSLKYKRDELSLVIGTDKKIYAIGGFGGPNNSCLKTVERLDPVNGTEWEIVSNLSVARRGLTAVTLPDGIYALGGFDGQNCLASVEKFDETLNRWVAVKSMNAPRCTLAAIPTPDCQSIYVMGGFDNGPLDIVERYSIIHDVWEIAQPMRSKRFMHSAVVVQA